jgi:hypothetical protein
MWDFHITHLIYYVSTISVRNMFILLKLPSL